jgi:hypothetical protein
MSNNSLQTIEIEIFVAAAGRRRDLRQDRLPDQHLFLLLAVFAPRGQRWATWSWLLTTVESFSTS